IADLDPEGPAAKDGLKAGDIVLSVNGEAVDRSSSLARLIGQVKPDQDVELKVMRDGKTLTQTVTVGDWPDELIGDSRGNGGQTSPARLGVAVQSLSDDELERYGVDTGVLVADVDPRGVAAESGIRPGDIIVSVDQQAVESGRQLSDIVSKLPSDRAVPVRIYRDGSSLFVALRLGDE